MIPKSLAEKATHRGQRVISLEMKHFACRAMAGSHVHMCPSSQAKDYSNFIRLMKILKPYDSDSPTLRI